MTIENNTTSTPAATLTENQLWSRFLDLPITRTMSFGSTVETYSPSEFVCDPGSYGLIDGLSLDVAQSIAEGDEPESDLDMWIDDLEGYVHCLKRVHDDFKKLKSLSLVLPPQPDFRTTSPEDYKAWERAANAAEDNPRYSLPASLGKTQHETPLDAANAIIGAMELAGLDLIISEPDELLAAIENVGPEQAAAELRHAADLLDSISARTEKEAA